jgi:hypothetical protein
MIAFLAVELFTKQYEGRKEFMPSIEDIIKYRGGYDKN